ncbi:guanylate kinase [Laetiporus sulphureus 93-53]|uniref:Guanylate kinase n=1 Tax=Laetiporus sulphureus 93-53 TaxID=1314785 RepID=A0A165G6B9_9APHY|nr:guanylate kinase [Laetiporus sulphureus 93-53]KZT09886.1 guanylate kinase [Laetiporus sulphureus 93-53]
MSPLNSILRPLVISGPSGVGKSTLLQRLFAEFPDKFGYSVSHTTRAPRPGETDGKQYHFVTRDKFKQLLDESAFIEHAEFSGNYYGTSFMTVREVSQSGRRCILDIEAQGVRQVKNTDLNPVYLFISPPSLTALRSRLRQRGTESEAAVAKRLATALKEIEYAKEGAHDVVIVNDDLDRAYGLLKRVALGEEITSDPLPPLDD